MTTIRQATTVDTAGARAALLALHGALLAEARSAHEREHGRVSNAAFLQLAAHDPAFAWLGFLLGLVVRLDMEEDREPILAQAAALLRCEGGGEFAVRYEAAIQRSPDVAVAAARARKAVRR
jgi:hypothetical protein